MKQARERKRDAKKESYDKKDQPDLLLVWRNYIHWVRKQDFSTDREYSKVLSKCLNELQCMEKYKNNEKFIDLWIRFACIKKNQGTIFKYMRNHGIGKKVAKYYIATALVAESKGNYTLANTAFEKGLENGAVPRDLLKRKQIMFKRRLADKMLKDSKKFTTEDLSPPKIGERNETKKKRGKEFGRSLKELTREQAARRTRLERTRRRKPSTTTASRKPLGVPKNWKTETRSNVPYEIFEDGNAVLPGNQEAVSRLKQKPKKSGVPVERLAKLGKDTGKHVEENSEPAESWEANGLINRPMGKLQERIMKKDRKNLDIKPYCDTDRSRNKEERTVPSSGAYPRQENGKTRLPLGNLEVEKSKDGLKIIDDGRAIAELLNKQEDINKPQSDDNLNVTINTKTVMKDLIPLFKSSVKISKTQSRMKVEKKDEQEEQPGEKESVDDDNELSQYLGYTHHHDTTHTFIEFNAQDDKYTTPVTQAPGARKEKKSSISIFLDETA